LLAWARSQTGNNIYNPIKTNLNPLISEILEVSKSVAVIKNISIQYTHADDIEVYADVNMLKTILRNLISNAIKYTHTNGVINISSVQNDKYTVITVSDSGVGMSEETRDKLFDVYTNITTTGTANEKGSGLGLVLCKEFVEQHGGEIMVNSEMGKGSTFTVLLPVG
jgi:signal transduction histidine kinase